MEFRVVENKEERKRVNRHKNSSNMLNIQWIWPSVNIENSKRP